MTPLSLHQYDSDNCEFKIQDILEFKKKVGQLIHASSFLWLKKKIQALLFCFLYQGEISQCATLHQL